MKVYTALFLALIIATQMNVNFKSATESRTVDDKPAAQLPSTIVKEEQNYQQNFDQQIKQWISTLAHTEDFEAWKQATWKSYPLGPGTHGWIILITNSDQEVGYLVVHTSPDGEYQLSEYGVGEYPLFSLNTLNRTLVQHELIPKNESIERIYLNAFQAVWRISGKDHVYYFDGVTGEAFPLNEKNLSSPFEMATDAFISSSSPKLKENLQVPLFDPYEQLNWINHKPIKAENFEELVHALDQPPNEITYTASIFDENMLIPFAVAGYQLWDEGDPYIALDQYSLRYIPYSIIHQQGVFYKK